MNTFVALGIICGVALIRGRRALKAGLLWMGLTLSAALFAFDSGLLLLSDSERPLAREVFLRDGRTNDVEILEAAWDDSWSDVNELHWTAETESGGYRAGTAGSSASWSVPDERRRL